MTHYAPVILEFLKDPDSSLVYKDFRIILPIAEIVSARFFDNDVYQRFQQNRDQAA